ncbi:MAG: glycosyltransferase family 2 protein [Magnetococcales bacterium]|nr:glycosyltransferase family 2 protein [Magnetococcales bacterium]
MIRNPPSVSIGVPVYNAMPYIKASLESLLSQDYVNYDLIISDNQSTDGTFEWVEQRVRNDPRVRLIRQNTNIGGLANFNFVLSAAKGDYFMWAAGDDLWSPDWISSIMSRIALNPDSIGGFGIKTFIDAHDNPHPTPSRLDVALLETSNAYLRLWRYWCIPWIADDSIYNGIYKRDILNGHYAQPHFFTRYYTSASDSYCWYLVFCGPIVKAEGIMKYRIHDTSASGKKRPLHEEVIDILNRIHFSERALQKAGMPLLFRAPFMLLFTLKQIAFAAYFGGRLALGLPRR